MGLFAPKSEGDFQKAPPGTHIGICYRIIDLGTQTTTGKYGEKKQRKVMLSFELINELMEDGRPFSVSSRYTLSGFQNALLRKHLESWRAKAYTDDEFAAFDITKLIGVPAMLTLTEAGDYVNITGISKLPKGTPIRTVTNEPLVLELSNVGFKQAVYDKLHDKLKETIAGSPEYKAIKAGKPVQDVAVSDDLNDEIPFDCAA
jgi:hypothetical protein